MAAPSTEPSLLRKSSSKDVETKTFAYRIAVEKVADQRVLQYNLEKSH